MNHCIRHRQTLFIAKRCSQWHTGLSQRSRASSTDSSMPSESMRTMTLVTTQWLSTDLRIQLNSCRHTVKKAVAHPLADDNVDLLRQLDVFDTAVDDLDDVAEAVRSDRLPREAHDAAGLDTVDWMSGPNGQQGEATLNLSHSLCSAW